MSKGIEKFFLVFFLFSILIISVYAAGGGGGGSSGGSSGGGGGSSSSSYKESKIDCETLSTLKARIKCRIETGNQSYSVPEPCRGLSNENECSELYKKVNPCYEENGTEKDICFKKIALYNKNLPSSVRNYLSFLLYDLQERVEEAYEDRYIDADQATGLIEDIIKIKVLVYKNRPASEIRLSIDRFKSEWKRGME